MKTPDEFRIPVETGKMPLELTAQMKWNIAETITRIKEDGVDLGAGDYVDVKDLKYICQAASYLMLYAQQLEAERDAAINALKNGDVCEACKHFGTRMDTEPCAWCGSLYSNFEWRGVQKEG